MSRPPGSLTWVSAVEPLVHARGLVKRFGGFTAVAGIDFDLQRGEAFGFLGPNGAGKSSTMRMIGCVSPPSAGELTVLGLDPVADGREIRSRLGVVPQGVTLILTTHYMDEAEQLCDRLVVMDAGKIAAEGSPRGLIEHYSTPEVLELRFDPADHQQAAEKLAEVPAQRQEVLADRVLLYV